MILQVWLEPVAAVGVQSSDRVDVVRPRGEVPTVPGEVSPSIGTVKRRKARPACGWVRPMKRLSGDDQVIRLGRINVLECRLPQIALASEPFWFEATGEDAQHVLGRLDDLDPGSAPHKRQCRTSRARSDFEHAAV
ncbi:hypothetical protein GCM10009657_16160 [Oryzihumus leptocrescens]